EELDIVQRLEKRFSVVNGRDERLSKYYDGQQRLEQIGLAVPPELARFETVVNWPRVVVDTLAHRQDVKALLRPGSDVADSRVHNLVVFLFLLRIGLYLCGRAFVSVGANEDGLSAPLISVESPRVLAVEVDCRRRWVDAALRFYDVENWRARAATLYLPNVTVWLVRDGSKWVESERDVHQLGRVPIVMLLNRRRTGDWSGRSEMSDIIPLTDARSEEHTS